MLSQHRELKVMSLNLFVYCRVLRRYIVSIVHRCCNRILVIVTASSKNRIEVGWIERKREKEDLRSGWKNSAVLVYGADSNILACSYVLTTVDSDLVDMSYDLWSHLIVEITKDDF
jgi:hypothetical protein